MTSPSPGRHPWHLLNTIPATHTADPARPPTPPRLTVPKTRPLRFKLGFPRFCDMERKFTGGPAGEHSGVAAGSSSLGKVGSLGPNESAAERWRAMVHEMLVEVVDQQGKAVAIARHLLIKSGSGSETDYNYAIKYILKLLYKDVEPSTFIKEHPNLRLQAWFEEAGNPSRIGGGGYGRYVDIDPDSWSEVWSFADRICVVY